MKKILIIRLSSIGDIVLTTPVVRCLKQQLRDNVELHYLTKAGNKQILEHNPYIDKIHILQNSFPSTIDELRKEKFDFIVDLHKNIRSFRIKTALRVPSKSFPKLNFRKWWYVHTKHSCLPDISIVDRYFVPAKSLTVVKDEKGLDFFLKEETFDIRNMLQNTNFVALVCGGKHATKQIPIAKIDYLCREIGQKIVLLGDASDGIKVAEIAGKYPGKVINACGKLSLNQSALLINDAQYIVTPDTGLMHIAAALGKRVISLWGNTVPEFGMFPYFPKGEEYKSTIFEVKGLPCRPCSKIGFDHCPKKHFKCMNDIDFEDIVKSLSPQNPEDKVK